MTYEHHFTPPDAESPRADLPTGWHNFKVVAAYDENHGQKLVTTEGVPYLKLKCSPDGFDVLVTYSLFIEAKNARKLDAFLWATGIGEDGEPVNWNPGTFEHATFSGKVAKFTHPDGNFDKIVRLRPVNESGDEPQTTGEPLGATDDENRLPF